MQEAQEELIEVDEEADLIQAERVLDDSLHQEPERDRDRQRKKEAEDMEELAKLMLAMGVGEAQPGEEDHQHGQQPPHSFSQAEGMWEVIRQRE